MDSSEVTSLSATDQGDRWKEGERREKGNKCHSQYGLTALSLCRLCHGIISLFELEQKDFRYYRNHIVYSGAAFPMKLQLEYQPVYYAHFYRIHVPVLWRNT